MTHSPEPAPPRHDGWTPDRQIGFLRELQRTRSVTRAAAAVGMSRETAYRLKRRAPTAQFALLWERILTLPREGHEGHARGHEGHARARRLDSLRLGEGHKGHGSRRSVR